MSDDRGRRRGGSERRASRSRSRARHSHSRSRDRQERRSRSRGRRRHSRSCSRDRYRRRGSSRNHERRRGHSSGQDGQERSPGRWQHDLYNPSARMRGYAAALSAGMDDDLDGEPYAYDPEGRTSAVLRLTGLPEDATEAELRQVFEPVAGVRDIRLPRTRGGQRGKRPVFMEFETPEAAAALMQSDWREQTFFGQHRLQFEYARPLGWHGGGGQHATDWVCEFCSGVNFGRRVECYLCQQERGAGAHVLPGGAEEEPSCTLRVGGLQPATNDEALRFLFVPHAPVKDIRLLRDRYTGELRGVAYVQFYSVEDAAKALAACQDAELDTQEERLHLAYAWDRFASDPAYHHHYQQGWLPPEAAAEAALACAGWQPKEFGEGGGAVAGGPEEDPLVAWERQQQAEVAAAVEEGQIVDDAAERQAAVVVQQPADVAVAALEQQRAAAEAAGFAFDPATGYMLEPASGYYYDANTGLYCHPSVGQWGTYDFATAQFVPHDAAAATAAAAVAATPGFSSAAEGALALGSAHAYSSRLQHGRDGGQHPRGWQQQGQQHHQGAEPQRRPKRGAVIGAAAQLDHRGLMEAARVAEEKVQLLRKQQEMEDAKRKAEAKRREAKQARLQLAPAIGVATVAAATVGAAAGGGAPATAWAAAAPGGSVQGVIHQSGWAAARRQQQQH